MTHRPTTTTPMIHLIAEDKTGEFVFKEILRKKNIPVRVQAFGKSVGVSTLANEIEGLIATRLQELGKHDCIVVLHDTDELAQTYRDDYKTIERVCRTHEKYVTRLVAKDEIEAWLLADTGFCRWLKITAKASDHIKQPSKKLETMINEKHARKAWSLQKRKILEQHLDASGDKLSESMKSAMITLTALPSITRSSRRPRSS